MEDWEHWARVAQGSGPEAEAAAARLRSGSKDALRAALTALAGAAPHGRLPDVVGALHDDDCLPLLASALSSNDFDVVVAAAQSLGRSERRSALEPLLDLLTARDRNEIFRAEAAEALGELGFPEATDALIQMLDETTDGLARKEWPALFMNSAVALAQLGDHRSAGRVIQTLTADQMTARSMAASALRVVYGEGAGPALRRSLGDEENEVRQAALDPIFLLGTVESVESLIVACDDESPDTAEYAMVRLGDLLGEDSDEYEPSADGARELWDRHRDEFVAGVCYRLGRPIKVAEIVQLLVDEPGREPELKEELRFITGLPVDQILSSSGVEGLQDRIAERNFREGSLYKWGRSVFPAR